jgi:hypothetical protein
VSNLFHRREFLRGLLRHTALGGIVAGSAYLILKPAGELEAGPCTDALHCGACVAFINCTLPRARSFRSTQRPISSEAPPHA